MSEKKCTVFANFGGPRSLDEIYPFLRALLCDQEVLQTPLPSFIHRTLFSAIAKRRVKKVYKEYVSMGGASPIFADTEKLATLLRPRLKGEVLTFHRYLEATHPSFIQHLENFSGDIIEVFPLFPQFSYTTTGSCALWFKKYLSKKTEKKLRWVKSYPANIHLIDTYEEKIKSFLNTHKLKEEDLFFLFSAHGIPKRYEKKGDIYQSECRLSFEAVRQRFNTPSLLCFQSKFGPGEWLRPYTLDVSDHIEKYCQGKKHILFIPISFTSDHIETLSEIENDYMAEVKKQGKNAYRLPALTHHPLWIDAIEYILKEKNFCSNSMLIRRK